MRFAAVAVELDSKKPWLIRWDLRALLAVMAVISGLMAPGCADPPAPPAPSVRLVPDSEGSLARGRFEVIGLDAPLLEDLKRNPPTAERWLRMLIVFPVNPSDPTAVPRPLAGSYEVEEGVIRFIPEDDLECGCRVQVDHRSSGVFEPRDFRRADSCRVRAVARG